MPQTREVKKRAKKKRQPSFTLPKNPHQYRYGQSGDPSKSKGQLVGTWTRLRSHVKRGQGRRGADAKVETNNGFLKLNEKVSQNLNVEEIGSWLRKQKELYARHKRPPAVPKRSPETKITTTELQPRELGSIDGLRAPPEYDDDEQAPESGYITPEQQSSELDYPVQGRLVSAAQNSPSGSVSSNQSTPRHLSRAHPAGGQGEFPDARISVASLSSVPSMPPPPPPADAMALQMNPLHRSSGVPLSVASSGSSSGTLQDPYQPDDLYQHYLPSGGVATDLLRAESLLGVAPPLACQRDFQESHLYEKTLPTPGSQTLANRPLPAPPGAGRLNNALNYPGRSSVPNSGAATMPLIQNRDGPSSSSPLVEEFPPPPPQFAGDDVRQTAPTSPSHGVTSPRTLPKPAAVRQAAAPDPLPTKNALPFPVKLRPTGSSLLQSAGASCQYNDDVDMFSVVVPPPSQQSKVAPPAVKPKSGVVQNAHSGFKSPSVPVPPASSAIPPTPSPQLPAPPSPISGSEYSEITTDHPLPPPPPPLGGMSADLVSRVQEWSITNQERPSRPGRGQAVDAHTALLNQIQTGIKLRKSPFSNKLFESSHKEEPPLQQPHVVTYPTTENIYADSIETCSTISADSSSSGCHSNSSYSNSTASSPPPQTPLKPGTRAKPHSDNNKMSTNTSNAKAGDKGSLYIDVTQLPGYQPIPSNCPAWKASMIEKKNQQLEEEARRKLLAQRQEEDRWKDIPEWKKNLILEKEKRKMEEEAPLEAERRKRDEEMARLQAMPEWKRDLILKKRGDQ